MRERMRDFFLKNEFWFVYPLGLFLGYLGGSNSDYVRALVFTSVVIITLLALKWIFTGRLFTRNRVE